ncbi:MAG: acetate--CoA ligase family protein [Planctomycetaceae bacterium]
MPRHGLTSFFSPKSIAVIGASDRPGSVGRDVLKNLRSASFAGPVYAINPRHAVIQGRESYPSLEDLPAPPELVVLCTAAETIPDLVTKCGLCGVEGVIVISAGFREMGTAGRALENLLKGRLREFPKMRLIGPNCLGIIRPASGLNASFSPVMPRPGRMTLLTQSGALATAIMDWSLERDLGFSACVSVGNMVDVGMGDLIDYFADDEQTDALLLYLEGMVDAPRFISAAQACSGKKPVVAFKAGRFEESARAAASHTGAIASQDAVFDAAFRRAGIERVHSIEELFDCARLLAGQRHALGNRLAIVTNAGGPGIMASDAWLASGGRLADLSDTTVLRLNQALPSCWSHGNPIDVLGDAPMDRFRSAIQISLEDPQVDTVLTILTPQTMTEPDLVAEAVIAAQQQSSKTIVACWMGGPAVQRGRQSLRAGGVPVYDFPEAAVQALHHLVSAGERRLAAKTVVPPTPSPAQAVLSQDRCAFWRTKLKDAPGLVNEVLSKQLLAECGIRIVPTHVAQTDDEAVELAEGIRYPVVLKVLSPDISHKTDVGGVLLNLADSDQVRDAYRKIQQSISERAPLARWAGIAVQPMISSSRGVELLLGMKRDLQFGSIVLLGAGGITAELQKDTVLELAPLDGQSWNHMLHTLRLYPLLEGYRGRPGVNLAALHETVLRFAQMFDELPELETAEINPLLATAEGVIALDARMISAP